MVNKHKNNCDMEDFVVFIISHGRPELRLTEDRLRDGGYTGRIIYVVDDTDEKLEQYRKNHGDENIFCFSKRFVAKNSDRMDNFNSLRATLYVRNEMWNIASELRVKYFLVLDDDYYYFGHRGEYGSKKTSHLDLIFSWFVDYLKSTPIKCLAFAQGGDHIGGFDENLMCKRKVMNAFFCMTDRPFKFYGSMNDDVNAYIHNGSIGDIYLTYMAFKLDQTDTQQSDGGLTETYKLSGTYQKSFYTIMIAPSCVTIKLMGCIVPRLHHSIKWINAVPCIIEEKYKKQ